MQLNQRAYALLEKYSDGLAQAYGQIRTDRYFSLTDPKETQMRDAMLEDSTFLNLITWLDVDQLQGQVVNVGNPGLFTGRKQGGRFIRPTGVDGLEYKLVETDSGAALPWSLLSVWANAGSEEEFFQRMQAFTNEAFVLDMLRIGFNGTSVAKSTDPIANPNGEDQNIGWHKFVQNYDANQIITTPMTLGEGGDYASLDSVASDLINEKIPAQHRNDPRLTVLVGGLSQDELPRFTVAANTLAMAVKSSAGEAADYMGSMYHKFDSVAEKMGRVPFAEQLASKTAYLAQAFGTDMQTIADLMEGARGVGANYGVGMDEQLAALGMLEKILGTEASSSYESFYKVAEDGAKQLGLSFVNSAGQMLSLPEMLTKLQGRYGASIEGNLKAQAELDKAFGDGANVIKQLYGNTDVLNKHIHALGSNDGLKRARDMAEKMIVPWDRLTAIWTAIRIAMGRTLLPVLYPFINKMADGGQKLARWLTLFPNIARVVGTAVLAFLSLAGAGAVVNIAMGVSAFVMVGLKGLWAGLTAIVKIHVAALWLYNKAVLAWAAVVRMMRGVLLAVRIAAVLTGIAMNFMSWPVLLIVGAVALLVVGCLALVKYWDTLKAAMMQTTAFKLIAAYVSWLASLFTRAWEGISAGWQALCAYFAGFSLSDTFAGMIDGVSELFTGLWASVKATFSRTWNTIAETLNHLPGVNLSLSALPGDNAAGATPSGPAPTRPASGPPLLTGGQTKGLSPGGLSREITTHQRSVTDNSRHINQVHIHTTQGMTPEGLLEWQEMHA